MNARKQKQLEITKYRAQHRIYKRAFFDELIFSRHPKPYPTSQAWVFIGSAAKHRAI